MNAIDRFSNIFVGNIHFTDFVVDTNYRSMVYFFREARIVYKKEMKNCFVVT